jgi:hypothetical protein
VNPRDRRTIVTAVLVALLILVFVGGALGLAG